MVLFEGLPVRGVVSGGDVLGCVFPENSHLGVAAVPAFLYPREVQLLEILLIKV